MTESETPLARYVFRRSALEQSRTYSIYPDRLTIEGGDLQTRVYPLSGVRKVRLKYEHTKQREYYQCFIETGGGRIDLRHVSWESFAKFEDRRASYTPFVRTVLKQVARYPGVRYTAGSMVNFIAAIAGLPLMTALGIWAITLGRIAPALFAGFMATVCIFMIGPSRPRRLDPLDPPADLLPE